MLGLGYKISPISSFLSSINSHSKYNLIPLSVKLSCQCGSRYTSTVPHLTSSILHLAPYLSGVLPCEARVRVMAALRETIGLQGGSSGCSVGEERGDNPLPVSPLLVSPHSSAPALMHGCIFDVKNQGEHSNISPCSYCYTLPCPVTP